MDEIQKEQIEGKTAIDQFVIINIDRRNLSHYNKPQYSSFGSISSAQASKMYRDQISAYDKLSLLVLDTAEQGAFAGSSGPVTFGPLEVPASGKISVPYAGKLNVLGKTLSEVEDEIKVKYTAVFNTAEISLSRVERQELTASVLGLVRTPGQHEILKKNVTIAELLAMSGGTTEEPYLCEYHVHRNKKTYKLNNEQITKQKILAQGDDLIEVKRSEQHFVTIMGAVRKPGNHQFPRSQCSLSDFLGEGAGVNYNQADATGIFIFRQVGDKTHIYRFNLKKPEGVIYASKFNVHGKDIVYVTEAPLSKWGRVVRGILPFGQLQSFGNVTNIGD